jgi:membrane carboxypeptidase/penicillin-binding protein
MMAATRGRPVEEFPTPEGTVSREVCAETGMLATEACPNVTTETFTAGSEPTELCTTHPGKALVPAGPGSGVAPPPPVAPPTLRDLDRDARDREKIHVR